jgi:hypothetical protein
MPKRKVYVGLLATQIIAVGVFVLTAVKPSVGNQITAAVGISAAGIVAAVLSYLIPEGDQA